MLVVSVGLYCLSKFLFGRQNYAMTSKATTSRASWTIVVTVTLIPGEADDSEEESDGEDDSLMRRNMTKALDVAKTGAVALGGFVARLPTPWFAFAALVWDLGQSWWLFCFQYF